MCYSMFSSVCSSTPSEGERKKGGKRAGTAGVDSQPTSGQKIKPKQFADKNVTCSEASAFADLDAYSYSTGQLLINDSSTTEILDKYYLEMNLDLDSPTISWQSTFPDCYCFKDLAVILSNGEVSNVYYYTGTTIPKYDFDLGLMGENGLVQPTLITFCYNFYRCKDDGGSTGGGGKQTAFAGNKEGEGPSWFYYVDTPSLGTFPIYAGQHPVNDAYVTITDENATHHKITIIPGTSGLALTGGSDSVKIHTYTTRPTTRPSGGHADYTGNHLGPYSVPKASFYVIHLSVTV